MALFIVALTFSFVSKALSGIFMKSAITHIERRFDTTSTEAGLIDGSFELGNLLLITLVSHFGAKSHIPRIIGIGCIIMGIGSFLTALPHFLMGNYRYDSGLNVNPLDNSTATCTPCLTGLNSNGNNRSSILAESGCKNGSGSLVWMYIMMGNMLRGIGETPIVPLGITYIDNFAKEGHATFYIGILYTLSGIGPIFGFLLGSLCAKLYVDIGSVNLSTIRINPTDSRWVGAWWLGFIISGILSILSGIPFFFIPKYLKTVRRQSTHLTPLEAHSTKDNRGQKLNSERTKKSKVFSDFFYSLKCILSNKLYILYLIITLTSFSSFIGQITHFPKYLQQQYDISLSRINFLLGTTAMPVVGISIFLGGYISKKLKLSSIGNIKLLLISRLCSLLLLAVFWITGCENKPIAGLTVTYNGGNNSGAPLQNIPLSSCNSDCNCDVNQWDPVCGDDGLTYLSPCLAGCKSSVGQGKDLVFHNCSCVEVNNFQSRKNSAHLGECSKKEDCSRKFTYYLIAQTLFCFLTGIGTTSSLVLVFRFVEPKMKSLAIGFHSLIMRILGGMLSPIYFGAIIDSTCIKWGSNNCGTQGACRKYDMVLFRDSFFGFSFILKIPEVILFIIFIIAVNKHYRENNAGAANTEVGDDNESKLKETLKNNEHLKTFPHMDNESHI